MGIKWWFPEIFELWLNLSKTQELELHFEMEDHIQLEQYKRLKLARNTVLIIKSLPVKRK